MCERVPLEICESCGGGGGGMKNPVIGLFLFHTVSLCAKRLEDFKEVHNLL